MYVFNLKNVVSGLLLGWYDVATSGNIQSILKQRCVYNVEHCRISVAYFNVDINNVGQRPNSVVILNVEFHNAEETFCIWPFSKTWKKFFFELQKKMTHLISNACFQLWSIKKKGKHGTYNVKINVGKYNAWYMKRIWK